MKSNPERVTGSLSARVARKRILVAEDDRLLMCCIEAILRGAGYQNLVFAADGAKALLRVMEEFPQLIILDAMMPRID